MTKSSGHAHTSLNSMRDEIIVLYQRSNISSKPTLCRVTSRAPSARRPCVWILGAKEEKASGEILLSIHNFKSLVLQDRDIGSCPGIAQKELNIKVVVNLATRPDNIEEFRCIVHRPSRWLPAIYVSA